jgi:hypothetical protein
MFSYTTHPGGMFYCSFSYRHDLLIHFGHPPPPPAHCGSGQGSAAVLPLEDLMRPKGAQGLHDDY